MSRYTIALNESCSRCGRMGRVLENEDGLCLLCLEADLSGVGASPAAPPVAVGTSGQGGQRPRLERANRPAGRGLAGSLYDLILRAERVGDQKFHEVPLPNGLHVEIGLGKQMNLRLYRRTATPSAREWQTVIDYLPAAYQPAAPVLPRDYTYSEKRDGSKRWYLEGAWPFRARP